MEDWKLEPARDLELGGLERYSSYRREGGLVESGLRLGWWLMLRGVFRSWNRLSVVGCEHLPAEPPYVVVANHASHLDALLLTTALPVRLRNRVSPIAAHDVFFESLPWAAFAATVVNALPIWRRARGRHALTELRARLTAEGSVYIIFPEGTRTRTGAMNPFKSGVGALVTGTPVPVVPGYISGADRAMPPNSWLLRPARLTIRLGPPLTFADAGTERADWQQCSSRLEAAVRELAIQSGDAPPPASPASP